MVITLNSKTMRLKLPVISFTLLILKTVESVNIEVENEAHLPPDVDDLCYSCGNMKKEAEGYCFALDESKLHVIRRDDEATNPEVCFMFGGHITYPDDGGEKELMRRGSETANNTCVELEKEMTQIYASRGKTMKVLFCAICTENLCNDLSFEEVLNQQGAEAVNRHKKLHQDGSKSCGEVSRLNITLCITFFILYSNRFFSKLNG